MADNVPYVLASNRTGRKGGAAYVGGPRIGGAAPIVKFERCLISGNTSAEGGALYARSGAAVSLVNCTVTGNSTAGGSAVLHFELGSRLELLNAVLWGNSPPDLRAYGRSLTLTYSVVQLTRGRLVTNGNTNADPLFVDQRTGDYHLRPGSPCIDAGAPNSPLDPDGTRADIGAFYFDQRQGR